MAQSQEDVILNIEVRYEDAVKKIAEYTQKLNKCKEEEAALKKEMAQRTKELKESNATDKEVAESQEKYLKSLAAVKAQMDYNKDAVRVLNKELQNNLKVERQEEGSLNQLRAMLSKANAEYAAMSEEERNTANGKDLQKHIADITAKLKEEEEALGDHRRSVGDYQKATRDLGGELSEIIKRLAEMKLAGEESSEEFKNLSRTAAELKQAVDEATQAINNQASNTSTLDGTIQSIETLVASYGLYKSALSAVGLENEELEQSVEQMTMVLTALQSLEAIRKATLKESSAYILAQNLLQKIGINQTQRQIAAEAALNKVKTSGSIVTKAVAAAQWLWNAALAANPVMLIAVAIVALIAGVYALTKAFGSSASATKDAEKASKAYEEQARKTADTIKQIDNDEKNNTNERSNRLRKEILELKAKGATAKEIADAEKKAQEEIRAINMAASKERQKQMENEEKTATIALAKESALLDRIARKKGKGSEAYDEQKKKVNELTTAYKELTQAIKEEQQTQADLDLQTAEAIQKEKEARNAAYKEYQAKQKDRADKQREAIRQAEDTALALIKEGIEKQRQAVNLSYSRQIEDLRRRLQQEKTLTKEAKDAINQTIQNLQQKQQNDLKALDEKYNAEQLQKTIDNETKLIELRLQSVKEGSEAEYQLRLQQLLKQEEAELNAIAATAENAEQIKQAIRDKYDKQYDTLEKQKQTKALADQKAAIDLEWRQRLDAVAAGSLEESSLKLQQAQAEYDALLNMDAEQKALLYGTGLEADTAYTNALLDNKERLNDAEKSNQAALQQATEAQLQAAQTIAGGFEEVLNAFGEDSEALAAFAKTIALFNIGLSTAEAISKGVAAAQSVPFPGNLVAIATTIATVMANIAKAKQLLSKEKQPKAPKFSAGGAVSGPGSGTSDSVAANLSSGESVLTASATSMFAPLLSALNQIGGGIPFNVAETSQQVIGEDMLARAFAKGVAGLPAPIVSVEEINNVNTRVKVLENMSRQ